MNVVKHARARSVQIHLQTQADAIVTRVADDGVGFDVTPSPRSGLKRGYGFGLRTVAARIEKLGGSVSVQSRHGRGTWVILTVPLESVESRSSP
jgi:signal transduction histidine kinase